MNRKNVVTIPNRNLQNIDNNALKYIFANSPVII